MLRKILKILIAFLLILVLTGYTALWFYVSNYHKTAVKENIYTLSRLPFVKSFDYDKLTVSGFPFCIKIAIVKPRIVIDAQKQDKNIIEIYPDQSFLLTTNPLVSNYTLKPIGDLHLVNHFEYMDKHLVIEHDSKLKLQATKSINKAASDMLLALMLSYRHSNLKTPFLRLMGFNTFSLISDHTNLYDYNTKQSLIEHDRAKLSLAFNLNLVENTSSPILHYEYKNLSLTEDFGPTVNEYYRQSGSTQRVSENQHFYGKMNGKGELSAKMGFDAANSISLKEPISVRLRGYENNDLSKADCDLAITLFFKQNQFDLAYIDYHATQKNEPKSFDVLVESCLNRLGSVKPLFLNTPNASPLFSKLEAKMEHVVPKLHELGQMDTTLSAILKNNDKGLNLNITQFDFINDLYDVHLKGSLNYVDRLVDGRLELNIASYQSFMERWHKTYAALSETNAITVAQLNAFINKIAIKKNTDANDIRLIVTFDSNFPFIKEINGQDINTLLASSETPSDS